MTNKSAPPARSKTWGRVIGLFPDPARTPESTQEVPLGKGPTNDSATLDYTTKSIFRLFREKIYLRYMTWRKGISLRNYIR